VNFRQIFAVIASWTDAEEHIVHPGDAEHASSVLEIAQAIGRDGGRDQQQERVNLLMQAIRLDGRNPLPVCLLIKEAGIYPHMAARALSQAAKDALEWYDLAGGMPAIEAARRRHEAREALEMIALTLHAAGRYQESHLSFLDLLRMAPEDAPLIRPWLASHALAIGDIFHVVQALKSADTNESGRYWCWIVLLMNRLTSGSKNNKHFRDAMHIQPGVADWLFALPPAPGTVDQRSLVAGSEAEDQFHAGLLWRPWGSHPGQLQWLREKIRASDAADDPPANT